MIENILVLGSKPKLNIYNIKYSHIYSSNGSAEVASYYQKKFFNLPHTCITSGRNLRKLIDIRSRIVKAKPNNLIIRNSEKNTDYGVYFKNNNIKITILTNFQQIKIQSHFLKKSYIDIISAEIFFNNKIFSNFLNFTKSTFIDRSIVGFSSGMFSCIYALKNHPKANVILSGISFVGGGHFYNSGSMSFRRGMIDKYLFANIINKYKSRIFTNDYDLHKISGIKYLKEKNSIYYENKSS
jgi:hypothetical protein